MRELKPVLTPFCEDNEEQEDSNMENNHEITLLIQNILDQVSNAVNCDVINNNSPSLIALNSPAQKASFKRKISFSESPFPESKKHFPEPNNPLFSLPEVSSSNSMNKEESMTIIHDESNPILEKVVLEKIPVDTVISCMDGKKIGAHRIALSAASPFFRNLLLEQKNEEVAVLIIPDVRIEIMKTLIHMAYYGVLKYGPEEEEEIFSAMEFLYFGEQAEFTISKLNIQKNANSQNLNKNDDESCSTELKIDTEDFVDPDEYDNDFDEKDDDNYASTSNNTLVQSAKSTSRRRSSINNNNKGNESKQCPKCMRYISSNNYKKHVTACSSIKVTFEDMQKLSFCQICDKQFKTFDKAEECLKNHNLECCLICLELIDKKNHLIHYKTEHSIHPSDNSKSLVIKCRWCETSYSVERFGWFISHCKKHFISSKNRNGIEGETVNRKSISNKQRSDPEAKGIAKYFNVSKGKDKEEGGVKEGQLPLIKLENGCYSVNPRHLSICTIDIQPLPKNILTKYMLKTNNPKSRKREKIKEQQLENQSELPNDTVTPIKNSDDNFTPNKLLRTPVSVSEQDLYGNELDLTPKKKSPSSSTSSSSGISSENSSSSSNEFGDENEKIYKKTKNNEELEKVQNEENSDNDSEPNCNKLQDTQLSHEDV